ncbi:DUF6088 family protein [Pseudomonas sp. F01002]|uniref:DUF6088 family protein n=1 Tax=Pseudomonas sp. F01002 TaxID=2555724 RepID=UPI00106AE2F4|nr:DUF6088 family protein [Pseudomonas sp. F01002]TFB38132.1 hypothetical protein E3W21_19445 [Pseudomonas sp. F01002]
MASGRPFHRMVFVEAGSPSAISKSLTRLVRAGLLERVARGIYMRPHWGKHVGKVRASPLEIMSIIAQANGETIQIHGAEAVRRFRLSNQMQVRPVYYTSGYTRDLKVGNAVIRLQHASAERLQHAGTRVGEALTALYYLGPRGASDLLVTKICKMLSSMEIITLRACRMPRWMSAALERSHHRSRNTNI